MTSDEEVLTSNTTKKWMGLISLVLFLGAFAVIHRELSAYRYKDILRQTTLMPLSSISIAAVLTIVNYLFLSGYDLLAMRYLHRPLRYGRVLLTSFISYVFSYNVGLSVFGGTAVRYRMYSAWGLSAGEIARVVAFCALTLWLGFFTLGGCVFVFQPVEMHTRFTWINSVRPIGFLFLALVVGYLGWGLTRKGPLRIRAWEFPVPKASISILQIVVSSIDWALAGLVLYSVMPESLPLSYFEFLAVFLLAQLAGLISHVPGGLGVFESVILYFLAPQVPAATILSSLLVYRGIYYFMPLLIGVLLLGLHELFRRKAEFKRTVSFLDRWVWGILPQFFAITIFLSGAILLFSGATPSAAGRLAWMKGALPLPVVEMSHFLGSIVGILLLFLAWGLQRRLDGAYVVTVGLLCGGILFSLMKGLDYEEATILGVMLIALLPSRRRFYRKTSFVHEPFTVGWMTAIFLVLLSSIWLGFFSYKHVEYSSDLWWRFGLNADAPRFLRASVGAVGTALILAVTRLLRPAHYEPTDGYIDWNRVDAALAQSGRTSGNLAYLGDKSFLFSESGRSFVMYGVEGRSWVALGDPVGPEEEMAELIWNFREMCDQHNAWPVFYEVDRDNLYLYIDLGLRVLKLGEEAIIDLKKYSLEGSDNKNFRYALKRHEKEGYTFEVLEKKDVPAILPELQQISDAWLEGKKAREKGFSLGSFSEPYLRRFPLAVIRKEGKIVAFANMWLSQDKKEVSIDLMRYLPEHSRFGIMDYLFVRLMLWGQEQGYSWFNLGMAPFSGLEDRSLSPLWNRLGSFVFRYGENFYNFQGVRQYKEKFHPDWQPKYLVCPGGLLLPRVLGNIASLISGGFKGVIAK